MNNPGHNFPKLFSFLSLSLVRLLCFFSHLDMSRKKVIEFFKVNKIKITIKNRRKKETKRKGKMIKSVFKLYGKFGSVSLSFV